MKRFCWLIPMVLAALVYVPSLRGEFVWDDGIVLQSQLSFFQTPIDAFFPPDGIPEFGIAYYRPIVSLSYLLDFGIYGREATVGPHTTNVLIHVLVTLFVFLLARRLLAGYPAATWGAVIAASIFAVHPIHAESVSWVSGRSDPLAAAFMLPTILLAWRYRDHGNVGTLVGASVLHLLALLTKEVAAATLVLVPLLFVLYPFGRGTEPDAPGMPDRTARRRRAILLGAGLVAATVVYIVLRQVNDVGSGAGALLPWSEWPGRLIRAGAYYLLKVVVPPPQSHIVPIEVTPGVGLAIVLVLAGAAVLGLALWRWRRTGDGFLLACLLFFGLTLAPSMLVAVGRISETPVAERYLYLPSIAAAVIAGLLAPLAALKVRGWPVAVAGAIVLITAYGILTVQRARDWTSDLRLWTQASKTLPNEGIAWLNLGRAHFQAGQLDDAFYCFSRALDSETRYDAEGRAKAHNNIGAIFRRQGRLQEAVTEYRAAIAEDPNYATPHFGLGMVSLALTESAINQPGSRPVARGHAAEAIEELQTTLRLNPRMIDAMWGLAWARIYEATLAGLDGETDTAEREFALAADQLDLLERLEPEYEVNGIDIEEVRARVRSIRGRLPQ